MTSKYYARVDYSYAGDSKFTIPFSFIKKEHIVVFVNEEQTTNYTHITSSQIEVKDILQAGDQVSIRRKTPINEKIVNFNNLNILNGETQNLAQEQVLNSVQEIYDENVSFQIDLDNQIDELEQNVDIKVAAVSDAVEKLNILDESVTTTVEAAEAATEARDQTFDISDQIIEECQQSLADCEQKVQDCETLTAQAKEYVDNAYRPPLLQPFWSDHKLNRPDLLLADTFSWQSGEAYEAVYNELVSEYDNENSVEETEGGITFKRTPKDYKIADSTQETAILEKYNTDGIAYYYILDKDNTQFKLPRTKFGFEGVRDSVGNDIAESLPNITGTTFMQESGFDNVGGSFYIYNSSKAGIPAGNTEQAYYQLGFDASLSSSTYQDNAPVQERATQMYLYFYVGNYTQSAIEQTAGLNSELFNNKADKTEVDGQWINVTNYFTIAQNITSAVQVDLSELIPKDGYIYELIINVTLVSTTYSQIAINGGVINTQYVGYAHALSTGKQATIANSVIVPINTNRIITVSGESSAKSNAFNIVGYRRLGKIGV